MNSNYYHLQLETPQNSINRISMGYVRFLHVAPNVPNVDIYVNDELVAVGLEYGMFTEYLSLPPKRYVISIYKTGEKDNSVLSGELVVSNNKWMTVAAIGTIDDIKLALLNDAEGLLSKMTSSIRFVHLSPNAPAVDITLSDGTILFKNVKYLEMTNYLAVVPKDYQLQVRISGTDQVVLTIPDIKLESDNYYSAYAIGLVDQEPQLTALLLVDGKKM